MLKGKRRIGSFQGWTSSACPRQKDKFINSLDVYANVICLCPTCHRLLHYGVESEKKNVIDKIYYDRADRLAVCGIKIGKKEFESLIK